MESTADLSSPEAIGTRGLRVLACASQGSGGDDEARLSMLLSRFETTLVSFSRENKFGSFRHCLRAVRSKHHEMFVLEGTGVAAGVPALAGALLFGRPFVLSSGDAVGPFLSARYPLGALAFHLYERLLYRWSAGFIGWTPYLVGRALTMGAKRAITCPGWAPYSADRASSMAARDRIRAELGIPNEAVVFGIAGSLVWSDRYQYCYGMEMIRALQRSSSKACVLIVGDGSGLAHLKRLAGDALGRSVFMTGRVGREHVPQYLAAMDIGSLPQSVDGVGSFRYTTKITEYRSAGLPFFTNLNPMAYDLDRGDVYRLAGESPWSEEFVDALSRCMDLLRIADLPRTFPEAAHDPEFDRDTQVRRVTAFIQDIVSAKRQRARNAGAKP